MVAKKKGAGGGLTRSQVVTVRLDPKLKFAAEMGARKQRRTISSFIEWAIGQSIDQVEIVAGDPTHNTKPPETINDLLWVVWDVEEPDRVVKLAIFYPELLTYEEEKIWKIISECGHFWKGGKKLKSDKYQIVKSDLHFDRVRANWENFHKIIEGELPIEVLSDLPVDPPLPTPKTMISDEVPF